MYSDPENHGEIRALLPNERVLRDSGVGFLLEWEKTLAADVLRQCALEYGAIRPSRRNVYEVDITVRCRRQTWEVLQPAGPSAAEPARRGEVRWGIENVLPGSFSIGAFEVRAMLLLEGEERVAPAAAPGTKPKGNSRVGVLVLGRFSYLPDFSRVWYDGDEFDLRNRPMARCCLAMMVRETAVDEESALQFDSVIYPEVKRVCAYDSKAPRIHDFFVGKLEVLREKLIRSAGRKSRFYLAVK